MKRTERDAKRTLHRKGKDVLRKAKFKEVKKNTSELGEGNREVGKTNLRLDYLLEEQRALREILTQINLMDMGELMKKITEHSLNLLKVDHVQIRLLDKDRFLRRVVIAGKGAERFQEGRRLGSGRSSWVMENRRALAIKNISQDKVFGPGHFLREIGVKGYLLLPLISREQRSIGVLGFSTLKEREFTQEEIALAEQFAAGAAIAVENANLYEEARRREEIQRLLKELNQEITSLDLDSLLKKLTEKVCGLLKVDVADVRVREGNLWHVRGLSGIDPDAVPATQTEESRGRSRWIIQHRKALVIPDIIQGEDIATGETLKALGIRGYLGVPTFSRGGEVIGVLRALTYQPREFTQEEVDLLQQLANGAAIALENTRLLDNLKATNLELERSSHEQQALQEFLSNLLLLDLDELLQRFTEQAVSLFHAEIAWVRLFDKEGKLWSRAIAGNEAVIKLMPLRAVGELVGRGKWMLDNRRPLAIKDMAQDPARPYPAMYKAADLHGFLGAPMFSRDQKPLGVIFVITRSPREFSQREIGLIEQFAAGAAIAIENARLYGETQRNLERIQALREIDQAITSTLNLRAVLNVLMEKIDVLLPYSAVLVWLLNRESGLLERAACWNLNEEEWRGRKLKDTPSLVKAAIETKMPVMASNIQTDPRTLDPEFYRRHGLVSYLGVPLLAKEEVLGILVFLTREEHQFTSEEIQFLSTLAGQAAIAIHNSQLYEEMKSLAGELERSNRVKDEFLGVMSHELRTPLGVIMGYAGILQDKVIGEINQEQEQILAKVLNQSKDLLRLVTSILQATSFGAGTVEAESHEVSLRSFLDELRSAYEIPIDKELILNWDYPSDLPVVRTDGEKLKHILQNLINNAIKFTEKGHVIVSARYFAGAERVEFKVTDTGIGIPKEALPFIFEMFRQVDSSETRLYGGVGLGLYIVKKFTELLDGKVDVKSEHGKGSTFTVAIPQDPSRPAAHQSLV